MLGAMPSRVSVLRRGAWDGEPADDDDAKSIIMSVYE
jgi:hypothetical protein